MSNLEEAYAEFWEDLLRDADASGEPQLACFFESYAPLAAENGDCGDLTYTPVRKDGATGYQVDGYAIDPGGGGASSCDLRLSGRTRAGIAEASEDRVPLQACRAFCERRTEA